MSTRARTVKSGLLLRVRHRIDNGRLPAVAMPVAILHGGYRNGAEVCCCDEQIAEEQMAYEVIGSSLSRPIDLSLHLLHQLAA